MELYINEKRAAEYGFMHHGKCFPVIILTLSIFGMTGCASVQNTMSAVDYACVDITIDTTVSDSGILGRGIVLPEGESLTAETVDLLCNY